MVVAGLECDKQVAAASAIAGIEKRRRFGMRATSLRVVPFTDDFTVLDNDGADRRIGSCETDTPPRELERPAHKPLVRIRVLRHKKVLR